MGRMAIAMGTLRSKCGGLPPRSGCSLGQHRPALLGLSHRHPLDPAPRGILFWAMITLALASMLYFFTSLQAKIKKKKKLTGGEDGLQGLAARLPVGLHQSEYDRTLLHFVFAIFVARLLHHSSRPSFPFGQVLTAFARTSRSLCRAVTTSTSQIDRVRDFRGALGPRGLDQDARARLRER